MLPKSEINNDDENFQLTTINLLNKLKTTRQDIKALALENRFLENVIKDENEDCEIFDLHHQSNLIDGSDEKSSSTKKTSTSSNSISEPNKDIAKLLSPQEKYKLALRQVKHLREKLIRTRETSDKLSEYHEMFLEEAELRKRELMEDEMLFKEIIIKNGVHPITGAVRMEQTLKYFNISIKRKSLEIERSRLRKLTLINEINKCEEKLKNEVIYPTEADCEKLKLDNSFLIDKLHSKNLKIIEYNNKLISAETTLNRLKMKLKEIESEGKIVSYNLHKKLKEQDRSFKFVKN